MRFVATVIIFSIVLLAPTIIDGSDAESYFAHYTSANDIDLEFENNGYTDSNGTLRFTTYSKEYDLNRSPVIFYEYNSSGSYGDTSKTYSFEVNEINQYGYRVDFTVKNVNADIEIIFTDPKSYSETGYDPTGYSENDDPYQKPEDPIKPSGSNTTEIDTTLVISIIAVLVSLGMLAFCVKSFNFVTSTLRDDMS